MWPTFLAVCGRFCKRQGSRASRSRLDFADEWTLRDWTVAWLERNGTSGRFPESVQILSPSPVAG